MREETIDLINEELDLDSVDRGSSKLTHADIAEEKDWFGVAIGSIVFSILLVVCVVVFVCICRKKRQLVKERL